MWFVILCLHTWMVWCPQFRNTRQIVAWLKRSCKFHHSLWKYNTFDPGCVHNGVRSDTHGRCNKQIEWAHTNLKIHLNDTSLRLGGTDDDDDAIHVDHECVIYIQSICTKWAHSQVVMFNVLVETYCCIVIQQCNSGITVASFGQINRCFLSLWLMHHIENDISLVRKCSIFVTLFSAVMSAFALYRILITSVWPSAAAQCIGVYPPYVGIWMVRWQLE